MAQGVITKYRKEKSMTSTASNLTGQCGLGAHVRPQLKGEETRDLADTDTGKGCQKLPPNLPDTGHEAASYSQLAEGSELADPPESQTSSLQV